MKNLNKSNFLQALMFIVIILGIPTLLINRVLYFNEGNDHIQVTIVNPEVTELDKIDDISGISRIDRSNKFIIIEKRNVVEVQNELKEKGIADESILVEEVISANKTSDIIINTLIGIALAVITVIGFSFLWSYYLNIKKITLRDFLNYIFLFTGTVLVGTFVQLTALRVFSRFYQIRFSDVSTIIIPLLITTFTYSFALVSQRNQETIYFTGVLKLFRRINAQIFNKVYASVFILVTPLLFGLGTQFVLPSIFIVAGVLVSFLSGIFVSDLYNFRKNIDLIKKVIGEKTEFVSKHEKKNVTTQKKLPKKKNKKSWVRSKKKGKK